MDDVKFLTVLGDDFDMLFNFFDLVEQDGFWAIKLANF